MLIAGWFRRDAGASPQPAASQSQTASTAPRMSAGPIGTVPVRRPVAVNTRAVIPPRRAASTKAWPTSTQLE